MIHLIHDERTLALHYNTLEALRADPDIQAFCMWLAEKPASFRPRTRSRYR